MHSIHDVAALVVERHGPTDLDKLHVALFYMNLASFRGRGTLLFPDNAIALPSGPVYPRLDVDLGHARWRRRFEARYGTKGRRGARRIPPMATLISEAA